MPGTILPLDYSGTSPYNRVQNEQHVLTPRIVRIIAPRQGAFFVKNLVITDLATNRTVDESSYKPQNTLKIPTMKSGGEVCTHIAITDSNVSNTVSISYNAVGSSYTRNYSTISNLLESLTKDTRKPSWPSIVGRPSSYPVPPHSISADTLIGMEWVVEAIDNLRNVILLGDTVSHDEILAYVDALIQSSQDDLETRISTELSQLLASSLTAANASAVALSQAQLLQTTVSENTTAAAAALALANTLKQNEDGAYSRAQVLVTEVLAGRTLVRQSPPSDVLNEIPVPDTYPHPVIDEDYRTIDTYGSVRTKSRPVENDADSLVSTALQTLRDDTTGLLMFKIELECADPRTELFYQEITDPTQYVIASTHVQDGLTTRNIYVSGGNGHYTPYVDFIIYPLTFSNDRRIAGDVINETYAGMMPVTTRNPLLELSYSGLSTKTYPVPGVAPADKRPLYWVLGVDNISSQLQRLDESATSAIERIASTLLDMRNDYNASGYGTGERHPVKLRLYAGTKISLTGEVLAPNLAAVLKSLVMPFRTSFMIQNSTGWTVSASNGQITGIANQSAVVLDEPDGNKVRALSADVDISIANVDTELGALATPIVEPTYFVAEQFKCSLTTYDTNGRGKRRLKVENISQGTVGIDYVEYFDGLTSTADLGRHFSREPGEFYTYANSDNAVIGFPVTPLGSSSDRYEYIRWYLTNGQIVIFGVIASSDTVQVTTAIGEDPPEYIPVFEGIEFSGTEAMPGETVTLTATFTGLKPNDITTVSVLSITSGSAGSIDLTATANGTATYTWTYTMPATDLTVYVTMLGTTKSTTVTRQYAPVLTGLGLTVASGVEGAASLLVAAFSGLKPNVTTQLTLSQYSGAGITTGTIAVAANSIGVGEYSWAVVVGQTDTPYSITYSGVTKSTTLIKNYRPVLNNLSLSSTDVYNKDTIAVTLEFTEMRPNATVNISYSMAVVGGDASAQTGTKTVAVTANASGVGTYQYNELVAFTTITFTATYSSITKTATATFQGPLLSSIDWLPGANGFLAGETVALQITFTNIPATYNQVQTVAITDAAGSTTSIQALGTTTSTYTSGYGNVDLTVDGSLAVNGSLTFTKVYLVPTDTVTFKVAHPTATKTLALSAVYTPVLSLVEVQKTRNSTDFVAAGLQWELGGTWYSDTVAHPTIGATHYIRLRFTGLRPQSTTHLSGTYTLNGTVTPWEWDAVTGTNTYFTIDFGFVCATAGAHLLEVRMDGSTNVVRFGLWAIHTFLDLAGGNTVFDLNLAPVTSNIVWGGSVKVTFKPTGIVLFEMFRYDYGAGVSASTMVLVDSRTAYWYDFDSTGQTGSAYQINFTPELSYTTMSNSTPTVLAPYNDVATPILTNYRNDADASADSNTWVDVSEDRVFTFELWRLDIINRGLDALINATLSVMVKMRPNPTSQQVGDLSILPVQSRIFTRTLYNNNPILPIRLRQSDGTGDSQSNPHYYVTNKSADDYPAYTGYSYTAIVFQGASSTSGRAIAQYSFISDDEWYTDSSYADIDSEWCVTSLNGGTVNWGALASDYEMRVSIVQDYNGPVLVTNMPDSNAWYGLETYRHIGVKSPKYSGPRWAIWKVEIRKKQTTTIIDTGYYKLEAYLTYDTSPNVGD